MERQTTTRHAPNAVTASPCLIQGALGRSSPSLGLENLGLRIATPALKTWTTVTY